MDIHFQVRSHGHSLQAAWRLDAAVRCRYVTESEINQVLEVADALTDSRQTSDAVMAEALRIMHDWNCVAAAARLAEPDPDRPSREQVDDVCRRLLGRG